MNDMSKSRFIVALLALLMVAFANAKTIEETEADLGTRVFPGSANLTKSDVHFHKDTKGRKVAVSMRATKDNAILVTDFYKSILKEAKAVDTLDKKPVRKDSKFAFVTGKTKDGATVKVSCTPRKGALKTLIFVEVTWPVAQPDTGE